ncbi:MAG: exonuclease domain-containing protein [Corynebacterium casei]|uniref:exonuclease domain-containing protein n=1 Tax=Corynebacterium casei TaxID=160386 RepID=UPI003F97496D
MTVSALGASLSISQGNLVYVPSQLTASLNSEERRDIALDEIKSVNAVQPSATSNGEIVISFTGEAADALTIVFAPNQDAEACARWINDVRSGKASTSSAPAGADSERVLAATATPGLDFVAVDVETANGNWGSICQIGAVRFVAGEETESKVWLCKPPAGIDHFDDINISIHGITADDVKDALTFAEAASELLTFMRDDVLVAHNAQFDSTALRSAFLRSQMPVPQMKLACSLALARHASKSKVLAVANHKLPTVAKAVSFGEFKHHDALDDARAAGHIISALTPAFDSPVEGEQSIRDVFDAQGFQLGTMTPEHIMPVLRKDTAPISPEDLGAGTDFRDRTSSDPWSSSESPATSEKKSAGSGEKKAQRRPAPWESVATPDTIPDPNPDADKDSPLYGQHVTLTGDFEPFDKGVLWNGIAHHGGQIGKNVTKKTTVLVLGEWATTTSKEKRADELNEKGQSIEKWPASKLFEVLELETEPPF